MGSVIYLHLSNPVKYNLITEGWFKEEGITGVQPAYTFAPWEKGGT